MTLLSTISVLFCHWLGDFVLQTDFQAKNKSKDTNLLSLHSFTYAAAMGIGNVFFNWVNGNVYDLILFGGLMFLTHFAIDYVTSRINSRLYAKGRIHYFFVSVGFDQFLHYAVVFGIVRGLAI